MEEVHGVDIALILVPEWAKIVSLDCVVEADVVACSGMMVVAARERG